VLSSSELAVSLLVAAERFLLDRLKAMCEDMISRTITTENVMHVLLTANNHGAETLKTICIEFITLNEEALRRSGALRSLMHEPGLMYEVLMNRAPSQKQSATRRGDGGAGS
jgi:hypothetical protein